MYKSPTWQWCLAPLVLVFACLSALRRTLFRLGLLSTYKSKLAVIVVGNITVGGNGKTPVTTALIEYFVAQGKRPAVLTRGYGGACKQFPHLIAADDPAALVGDEPAMLKSRYDIPIVVDPQRRRGMRFIEQSTDADIVICDDGLQHYALGRDIELCVMDERGVGNGFLLPMGPLRENLWRLRTIDMVLVNGEQALDCLSTVRDKVHHFTIKPAHFVHINSGKTLSLEDAIDYFQDKDTLALAGIGNPQRFFNTLNAMGITPNTSKGFADHYAYNKDDLMHDGQVLMTEKDAIKCKQIAEDNCWFLQINAEIPVQVYDCINAKLHV